MKKITAIFLVMAMVFCLAACQNGGDTASTGSGTGSAGSAAGTKFDATKSITVISREEGSGTRDAFIELTGVQTKDADGKKTDNTTDEAVIIDGTQAVMSSVVGNEYAIGYISLGSLNNTVKAVKVGGVTPSAAAIKDGSYVLSRPFNIATKDNLSAVAQDFVDYILSTDGQKIVADAGCVTLDGGSAYARSKPSGKIVVAGSSSVSPVMEKLKEAYLAVNPNATIEIQTNDSSSGINAAKEGTCDIGMASRALKDSEKETLTETKIAMDGIAVIVHKDNPTENLTKEQIAKIFTGAAETWDEIG